MCKKYILTGKLRKLFVKKRKRAKYKILKNTLCLETLYYNTCIVK